MGIRAGCGCSRTEVKPSLLLELLGAAGVGQVVGGVIRLEEVLDDRARLPELNASVGVFDGGDTAVLIEWAD